METNRRVYRVRFLKRITYRVPWKSSFAFRNFKITPFSTKVANSGVPNLGKKQFDYTMQTLKNTGRKKGERYKMIRFCRAGMETIFS
jgi:hypothetical protein